MFAGLLLLFCVLLKSGEAFVPGGGEGGFFDVGERCLCPVNKFLNLFVGELEGEVVADAVSERGVGDLEEGFGLFLDGLAYGDEQGLERTGAGAGIDVDGDLEPGRVAAADFVEKLGPLGVVGPELVDYGFGALFVDLLAHGIGGGQRLGVCGCRGCESDEEEEGEFSDCWRMTWVHGGIFIQWDDSAAA